MTLKLKYTWCAFLFLFAFSSRTSAAEYIIKFSNESQIRNFRQHLAEHLPGMNSESIHIENMPLKFRQLSGRDSYYKIVLPDLNLTDTQLSNVENIPGVAWLERNNVMKLHHIPTDTLYGKQWAMTRIGMESAWDISRGDPSVIVGVIDTGVDYNHPDLQSQIWVNSAEDLNQNGFLDAFDINGIDDDGNGYIDDVIGWDFTDAPNFPDAGDYLTPDNDPIDEFPGGHGTGVAGLIAAVTDNVTGMASVSPQSKIMCLRAGTANGFLEEDDVAEAILYGVDNGCKIINMSFGDVVYSHLIKDAVVYGTARGVLFVTSAGNSGNTVLQFPAAYDETISVGAIAENNMRAGFSSYGSKLDLVAPGQEIWSLEPYEGYRLVNGTSFSSPLVCGALASIWALSPNAGASEIKAKLFSSCMDLGAFGWDYQYGNGLLMVSNSLQDSLPAFVDIQQPATRTGIFQDIVPVTGTAAGPGFIDYTLSYGVGELPLQFNTILNSRNQVINDTLGNWDISMLPDTTYTLELSVEMNSGEVSRRNVIYIDRTPPVLDSIQFVPVRTAGQHAYLIELVFDDPVNAEMFFREKSGNWQSQYSGYTENTHAFLLTENEIQGELDIYFSAENVSGIQNVFNNNGEYYQVDLASQQQFSSQFEKLAEIPGVGYFLDEAVDLDGDGSIELAAYAATAENPESHLSIFSIANSNIQESAANFPLFPRDLVDLNSDGKLDLLCGFGGTSSFVPGENFPAQIPSATEFNLPDLWVAKAGQFIADDPIEILAIHQNEWHVFQINSSSPTTLLDYQILENPTAGSNNYGVPFILTGDYDNDGRSDILLGDYDGDLIIYEIDAFGIYHAVFSERLLGINATSRLAAGDFDGDGTDEIAAVTQKFLNYVGESAVDRQYWILSIFGASGNNQYELLFRQNFLHINDQKGLFNGISAADYDNDQKDELFFGPYPDLYFFKYDEEKYLELNWFNSGINANVVPKIEQNRFLLVGDSTISIWEIDALQNSPAAPLGVKIVEADTAVVNLIWKVVPGATDYRVLRKNLDANLIHIFSTQSSFLIDSTVTAATNYQYVVKSVDSSYTQPLSAASVAVRLKTLPPPEVTDVSVIGNRQMLVSFNKRLGAGSFNPQHYFLNQDNRHPKSALRSGGKFEVLLTFNQPLEAGDYILNIFALVNEYNVPFLIDTLEIPVQITEPENAPYVTGYEMPAKNKIRVTFSEEMDEESLLQLEHYRIEPDIQIYSLDVSSNDARFVDINLSTEHRIGALGEHYILELRGLKSKQGVLLAAESRRLSLAKNIHHLDELVVFPNPLKASSQLNEIRFGNVPAGSEIYIFTSRGKLVRDIKMMPRNGAISWDLKNSDGQQVGNGIYIYRVIYEKEEKTGKFALVK